MIYLLDVILAVLALSWLAVGIYGGNKHEPFLWITALIALTLNHVLIRLIEVIVQELPDKDFE